MNSTTLLPKLKETFSYSKTSRRSDSKDGSMFSTEQLNPFKAHLEKVIEIKIFLKQNFHKTDIDDNFLNDLDVEYATQFLEKMNMLPTKANIRKLLKLKPMNKCDFSLTVEQIRNKTVKLLHIFPNPKNGSNKSSLKSVLKSALSNEEFEDIMAKTSLIAKDSVEDKLTQLKKREIKKDEIYLYIPETIENIIAKAKEEIQDKKLTIQSHGMIEQHGKVFDLSIQNIRNKYLNPNPLTVLTNSETKFISGKAKFQNIDKVSKLDIFSNDKYEFPYLEIDFTKDLLIEVNKPIEIPVEVIVKDINYILDNFPIEQLVNLEDPNKKTSTIPNYLNIINPMNNTEMHSNYVRKTTKENMYHKIKLVNKVDLLYVYKKIQSASVYRIIGLLVNLIYWIVFGFLNRVQIDKVTKQHIFFKILEELYKIELSFKNKKIFDILFMPILIIVIRIECEAIFQKKFSNNFNDKKDTEKYLQRINELITIIFDPNCYFNTFTVLASDMSKLKHKISKNLYPNYKSKINATSNLINQLFTSFTNEKNVKKFMKNKNVEDSKEHNNLPINVSEDEWERERKYVLESKVEFYRIILKRINQSLKKRNLEPIFSVSKAN